MTNKFASICYRCGGRVMPGRGECERVTPEQYRAWSLRAKTKWLVVHPTCKVEFAGTDVHFAFNPAKRSGDL